MSEIPDRLPLMMLGWFGRSGKPSPSADDLVLESLEAGRAVEVFIAGQSLGTSVEHGRESEKSSSLVGSVEDEEEEEEDAIEEEEGEDEEEEEEEEEEVDLSEPGAHVSDVTARYDSGAGVLGTLPSPAASETGSRQSIVSVNAPPLPPRRVSLDSQGSRGSSQISSIEGGGSRHTF